MNKNLVNVTSSQIKAIGHEGTTLTVLFNNASAYEYANVPAELHKQLMEAESVGSFFSHHVKKYPLSFPYTKVL